MLKGKYEGSVESVTDLIEIDEFKKVGRIISRLVDNGEGEKVKFSERGGYSRKIKIADA